MKDFLMKHGEDGKPTFVDKQDKATFELLLSSYKERNEIFVMTISQRQKKTSENQIKLWNVLMSMISQETGNDVRSIEETVLSDFSKLNEKVETMGNDRFQELLLYTTNFANEFFNLNITLENERFQTKKMR